MSRTICLYLHVHQPYRVSQYSLVQAGSDHKYFLDQGSADRTDNRRIFEKVAAKSYLPTNEMLMRLIQRHPHFKVSLSITGTVLEQMEAWAPEVLASFQRLVATGNVEIVGETYHHSLAFFYDRGEFEQQVALHAAKVKELFGVKPKSFRNTELSYNNELAHWADSKGYKAVVCEGWDPVLDWRSPNYVYRPAYTKNIKLLMKNYRLSDDIAFRFSNRAWDAYPLMAQTYVDWLNALDGDQQVVNLFMDYETFGEHQWAESGIYGFFEDMVARFLRTKGSRFMTLSEAAKSFVPRGYIDTPKTTTWADAERDLSAWYGNAMQKQALHEIYTLHGDVLATKDPAIIADWRRLQTSDHFYYMCTKYFSDGDIHAYFSPYESPYDAFVFYMNAIRDLKYRLHHALARPKPKRKYVRKAAPVSKVAAPRRALRLTQLHAKPRTVHVKVTSE